MLTNESSVVNRAVLPEFNSTNSWLLNATTETTSTTAFIDDLGTNSTTALQPNIKMNEEYLNETTSAETINRTTIMAVSNRTQTFSTSTVASTTTTTRSTSSFSVPLDDTSLGTDSGESLLFVHCQLFNLKSLSDNGTNYGSTKNFYYNFNIDFDDDYNYFD